MYRISDDDRRFIGKSASGFRYGELYYALCGSNASIIGDDDCGRYIRLVWTKLVLFCLTKPDYRGSDRRGQRNLHFDGNGERLFKRYAFYHRDSGEPRACGADRVEQYARLFG